MNAHNVGTYLFDFGRWNWRGAFGETFSFHRRCWCIFQFLVQVLCPFDDAAAAAFILVVALRLGLYFHFDDHRQWRRLDNV